MAKQFAQMTEAERTEWKSSLRDRTLQPQTALHVDPQTESVYEYRSDLNATIENTPDGRRFSVVFRDGGLHRQELP